jgi:hypothetical protein
VVEQAGVADQGEVGGQQVAVGFHEGDEGRGARLLLAFEEQGDARGERAVDRAPGAAGLDEGHELALVVGGAATADDGACCGLLHLGDEGGAVPKGQRINGLHVVVAVEEEVAPALAALAHDHWAARGGVGVGSESHVAQVLDQPVGRRLAVLGVDAVGGDGGDAQEGEQPLDGVGHVRVDAGQDGVEHGGLP